MRISTLISVVAMLGLVACQESVGPAGLEQPSQLTGANKVVQSATGSGHFSIAGELRTFTASAVKRADESVTGQAQVNARQNDIIVHLAIDCLNIVGNIAVMSGVITGSDDPAFVGSGSFWAVRDNGEGANAPPDDVTLAFLAPVIPDLCVLVGLPGEGFFNPIEAGNIQVRP